MMHLVTLGLIFSLVACKTAAPRAGKSAPSLPPLDEAADVPFLGLTQFDPATYPLDYLVTSEPTAAGIIPKIIFLHTDQDWAELEVCEKARCISYKINTLEAYLPLTAGSYQLRARACFGYGATASGQHECGAWGPSLPYEQVNPLREDAATLLAVVLDANAELLLAGEEAFDAVARYTDSLNQCPQASDLILRQAQALRRMKASQFTALYSAHAPLATAGATTASGSEQLGLAGPPRRVAARSSRLSPAVSARLQQEANVFTRLAMTSLTLQTLALVTTGQPLSDGLSADDLAARAAESKTLRGLARDYHKNPTPQLKVRYQERLASVEARVVEALRLGGVLLPADQAFLERFRQDWPALSLESQTTVDQRVHGYLQQSKANAALAQLALYERRVNAPAGHHITRKEAAALRAELLEAGAGPSALERLEGAVARGRANLQASSAGAAAGPSATANQGSALDTQAAAGQRSGASAATPASQSLEANQGRVPATTASAPTGDPRPASSSGFTDSQGRPAPVAAVRDSQAPGSGGVMAPSQEAAAAASAAARQGSASPSPGPEPSRKRFADSALSPPPRRVSPASLAQAQAALQPPLALKTAAPSADTTSVLAADKPLIPPRAALAGPDARLHADMSYLAPTVGVLFVVGSIIAFANEKQALAANCEQIAAKTLQEDLASLTQQAEYWRSLRNGSLAVLLANDYLVD